MKKSIIHQTIDNLSLYHRLTIEDVALKTGIPVSWLRWVRGACGSGQFVQKYSAEDTGYYARMLLVFARQQRIT